MITFNAVGFNHRHHTPIIRHARCLRCPHLQAEEEWAKAGARDAGDEEEELVVRQLGLASHRHIQQLESREQSRDSGGGEEGAGKERGVERQPMMRLLLPPTRLSLTVVLLATKGRGIEATVGEGRDG